MSRICNHGMIWGRCPNCEVVEITALGDKARSFLPLHWASPQMIVTHPTPTFHYAPRTWADLHLEQLGYGLLGAFAVFVGVLGWILT